jgi:zinc D-Ala-D-Ala carboxypeptidase
MARIHNRDALINLGGKTVEDVDSVEQALNIMHSFRTYSYHHILVAANTTAAAEFAMKTKDINAWIRGSADSYESKFKPQKPPGVADGKDAYMVLINGLTDAEFVIQGLEIETIVDPNARTSNPHASYVEGSIEIMEPKGVRFMNLLKDACDKLNTDPNGLTFVLKTIFVGYTDGINGEAHIHQLLETKPFHFLMVDLTGEFTAAGSTYNIQFVGHINGTPRLPIFSKLEQSNVKGGTVREALAALEKKLNEAAEKSYTELVKQLDESNNTAAGLSAEARAKYSPAGRKIIYTIAVAEEFAALPLDNVHPRNTDAGGEALLATPQGIDIETAISDILLSSTKIADIMNKDIEKGFKSIFKIDSVLETTTEAAHVTFSVKSCKVPMTIKDNRGNAGKPINPDIISRYIIEFDYIFTGANIDVLEYDMKMALGIAFFQSFGSSSNLPGDFHGASGDITTVGSGSGTVLNTDHTVMRQYSIVPAAGTIADPTSRNKRESAKTADFRTLMARQSAFESINSKLRITGIPWLLGAFSPTAEEISNPEISAMKEQVPLIKVNVKMPARDNEFAAGSTNFSEEFWYTGYFQIMSIKSVFRDGKFDQELDLIAQLYEELVSPTGAGPAPAKRTDDVAPPQQQKPATASPGKANKPATPAPKVTAEQKAKTGVKSVALSPEELLNCQSVRKQPITMASARRTFLSKTITLDKLIRRDINIPHLTDRIMNNLCALAKQLEQVQTLLGHNITITSGFRCAAYNAGTRGSSKTSDHMQGVACDFICPAFGSPHKIYEALKGSGLDFRQVICETSASASWIHVSFNIDSSLKRIADSVKFIPNMRV